MDGQRPEQRFLDKLDGIFVSLFSHQLRVGPYVRSLPCVGECMVLRMSGFEGFGTWFLRRTSVLPIPFFADRHTAFIFAMENGFGFLS